MAGVVGVLPKSLCISAIYRATHVCKLTLSFGRHRRQSLKHWIVKTINTRATRVVARSLHLNISLHFTTANWQQCIWLCRSCLSSLPIESNISTKSFTCNSEFRQFFNFDYNFSNFSLKLNCVEERTKEMEKESSFIVNSTLFVFIFQF